MEKAILKFKLNENLYLRDPQDTDLGQKIITHSINLIDSLGFEQFTFKKLAIAIESTEASIYRYFENKNKLLIFIVNWHWLWLEYRIEYYTHNITTPEEKLSIIFRTICETQKNTIQANIDEKALYRIVIAESAKAYLIKEVDENNKFGIYSNYKKINNQIANLLLEINPNYKYPNALVSTILETAHQQLFFSQHLPSLTNIKPGDENSREKIQKFIEHVFWSSIRS